MGLESEFGILSPTQKWANPVILSSQVVTAYGQLIFPQRRSRMMWDYDVEFPLRDARGFDATRSEVDPSVLTHEDYGVANLILPNGARFYVDHAHPEYSSPETSNPRDAALWDAAGDVIIQQAAEHANHLAGELITVYKNNSDGKGASYGTHENYQVNRAVPFDDLVHYLTPFFVTRCIYAGSGRVGLGQEGDFAGFQISSRADFFEAEVGLETTLRRPIINTRDEPHADPATSRRLHVIIGDANMSQYMTFIKMGVTAIVLTLIEQNALGFEWRLSDPVISMHLVSHDLDLARKYACTDGQARSALDIQFMYLSVAQQYYALTESVDDMTREVLCEWERLLNGLAHDPHSVMDSIDWIAKREILDGYRKRDGLTWSDPRLTAIDLQYADLRPAKGVALLLQRSGRMRTLFTSDEIDFAVAHPPRDTRAYVRGTTASKFPEQLVGGSWDSLVFDLGPERELVRIPTPNPRAGTATELAELFATSTTIEEFCHDLQAMTASTLE